MRCFKFPEIRFPITINNHFLIGGNYLHSIFNLATNYHEKLLRLYRQTMADNSGCRIGYYVDAYDLLVFSAVRKTSLMALGVAESDTFNLGLNLLNWQLIGLVIGGLLWGILADKFGRRSILFVSIITYSLANLANAFVNSVDTYIILRIIAGIGLAGELGVGMTLLTENLPKEKRTYATTIVTFFGMLGAASAGIAALHLDWKKWITVRKNISNIF